jgi:hypothetical protein
VRRTRAGTRNVAPDLFCSHIGITGIGTHSLYCRPYTSDAERSSSKSLHNMQKTCGDGAIVAHPLFHAGDGGSLPTSPLQFTIVEIGVSGTHEGHEGMRLAAELNRKWHSVLPRTDLGNLLCGNMSLAYAAEYEGRYYAVGIWSQPIIRALCDGHTLELRRLAICSQAPKCTASRMLRIMRTMIQRKMPHIDRLISYQAVDVHRGTIYRAAGWRVSGKVVAARPQRVSGSRQRATGPLQTTSRKVRWELLFNRCSLMKPKK